MNAKRELHDKELDALKEVANIGAGHAATALSQLTSRRIMIDVPKVQICTIEEAASAVGDGGVVAAVLMQVLGDLTGRSLLLFEKNLALQLADMLLTREPGTTKVFAEFEQSALKETNADTVGAEPCHRPQHSDSVHGLPRLHLRARKRHHPGHAVSIRPRRRQHVGSFRLVAGPGES